MATAISPSADPASLREIFVSAIGRLVIGWLAAAALVTMITAFVSPVHLGLSIVVALASGVIAVAALLPGFFLAGIPIRSVDPNRSPAEVFLVAILLAMSIRCLGTVALFLLCRYQMDVPGQTAALFVCGWYALLTSVEVSLLARNAKAL